MISRFNDPETKKRESYPQISFIEPEITVRSTLEEGAHRGGKAVEERAPSQHGGAAEFSS
jgi:hypothetical protein